MRIMRTKIFNMVLPIFLIAGLIGCLGTSKSDFPTIAIHISDECQIGLGMQRDDVENVLERMSDEDESIVRLEGIPDGAVLYGNVNDFIWIIYSDDDTVWNLVINSKDWTVAGFSLGDEIQSVIDNDKFGYVAHLAGVIGITDDPEYWTYLVGFGHVDGIITSISLSSHQTD